MADQSFSVRGPRLFNCLPVNIRNADVSYDAFKARLDKILGKVPDTPSFPNYRMPAVTNSLVDQIEQMKRDGVFNQLL